jgi:hypothetical protein
MTRSDLAVQHDSGLVKIFDTSRRHHERGGNGHKHNRTASQKAHGKSVRCASHFVKKRPVAVEQIVVGSPLPVVDRRDRALRTVRAGRVLAS